MNLLQNRVMHPQLRDEESLVVENAIRLAIDSIINVLYSVNGTRTREYERMLGDRDKEIRRLSSREKDFERELQLLRRRGCSCGLYDANDEHCSGFPDRLQTPECSDPRPGCEDAGDEMAAAAHGQCEMSFSLGLFDTSPSQASAQSQDLAAPPPAIRPAFQHTPEAIEALGGRQTLSSGPVIKEEPSDMDAICESSDLRGRTGKAQFPPGGPCPSCHPPVVLQEARAPRSHPRSPPGGSCPSVTPPRQQLEPDEAQRLKREAWRAASRRYYARKMARLRAHRPPQGQLHPLGATASPCFLPASMTTNNNNNSHSSINNNNNNNRKRRKRILDLPEETQSSQREAWRAASKRYYARRSTGLHPDPLDLAHFLQDTQGMSAPQS
ncbi:unnamed protein product [Lota lota]